MNQRGLTRARTVADVTPLETHDMKSQVCSVLRRQLRLGKASMASVAQLLGTSEATLRRRLLQEGSSFSSVLDEVRFELARRYLADPTLQLADVAQLLGFRDPATFVETFERWAGLTPESFRANVVRQ